MLSKYDFTESTVSFDNTGWEWDVKEEEEEEDSKAAGVFPVNQDDFKPWWPCEEKVTSLRETLSFQLKTLS